MRDPRLGAGTVLEIAREVSPAPDAPLFLLERPWRPGPGPVAEHLSIDELVDLVDRHAATHHRNGVRPKDVVALYLTNGIAPFIHYLALCRLGAIAAPFNPALPADWARRYLDRVSPRYLVTDADHRDAVAAWHRPVDWLDFGEALLDAAGSADLPAHYPYRHADADPVLITHSSGTTGPPKPITCQHRQFFVAPKARLLLSPLHPTERTLTGLPHSHGAGIVLLMQSLIRGVPTLLLGEASARAVLDGIEGFRPTTVIAFSHVYADLAELPLDGAQLDSVQLWISTADAAHERHIRQLVRHGSRPGRDGRVPGSEFVDGLGSSEMGNTAFRRSSTPDNVVERRHLGRPASFVEVAVLDDDGSPLPPGRVGKLGVRGPTLTYGYWNDSQLTFRSQLGGYWLTGDLVWADENGEYFHADRISDSFPSGGGIVYSLPMEEAVMASDPAVADCTVIGVAKGSGGLAPVALVRARKGGTIDPAALLSSANANVRQHGWPTFELLVLAEAAEDWPLGPTGKVLKRQLRARYEDALASGERRRQLAAGGRAAYADGRP
jgi:long-chain acyl-CoA synthetase